MSVDNMSTKNANRAFTNSKLNYVIEDDRVIVTQRRTVTVQSPTQSYGPGDVIDMTFGSEQDYIYGPNCYLMFKIKENISTSADKNLVKWGSYVNALQELKLTAKSIEIEHLRGLDTLTNIKDNYTTPTGYMASTGTLMGYESGTATRANYAGADGKDYAIIPFHHISGFFSQDKYIPLPELGNLRIELTLNSFLDTFKSSAATPDITTLVPTYAITDFKIVLDAYRMTDVILGAGRAKSKAGQLALSFDTYHYDKTNLSTASNTIELKKSVAKALSVFARVKETPATGVLRFENISQGAGITSGTAAGPVRDGPWLEGTTKYQWVIGSEYHPSAPVTKGKQGFAEALKAFGNLSNIVRHPYVDYTSWLTYDNIMACDLERDIDNTDLMSGISTKEGNRIVFEYTSNGNDNQFVELYLHHLRLILIHTDSILCKD